MEVYAHRNKINNCVYIGIAENSEKRWGKDGYGYQGQKFYEEGIKIFGWDNFDHIILNKNLTRELAEQIECRLIKQFNATNDSFGYNENYGSKVIENDIYDILANAGYKTIKEGFTSFDIQDFIKDISSDYLWKSNSYTIDFLVNKWNEGLINTELDCQRAEVWNDSRQQNMWDTVLRGQIIPEIHAIINSEGNRIWEVVDGKQRLTTLVGIINNQIPLKKSAAKTDMLPLFSHMKKNILFFEELPEAIQKNILRIQIRICEYENISSSGMLTLFHKLNAGVSLGEFDRLIASNILLRTHYSRKLDKHPFFTEKIRLLNSANNREICLVRALLFYYYGFENYNMSNKYIYDLIKVFNENNLKSYTELVENNLDLLQTNENIVNKINNASSPQLIVTFILGKMLRGEWSIKYVEEVVCNNFDKLANINHGLDKTNQKRLCNIFEGKI